MGIFKKLLCITGSAMAMILMCGLSVQAKEVVVENNDIQAALSQAANEEETLTVVIPAGEYTVNGKLYVYPNTVIKAEGATIIKGNATPNEELLTAFGDAAGVTVHGGTWVASGWAPIQLVNASQWTLDGVKVESAYQYGINLVNATGIIIKDSTLVNCGISGDAGASNLTISGNKVQNASKYGIWINATSNNVIQGNTVTDSGRSGIELKNDQNSVIDNNTISGSALTGVKNDHGEGLVVDYSNGTKVTNNRISDTHSNVADNGNGIIVGHSEGVTVDSNTVTNSGNHGIQVSYQSKNVVVSNNEISVSGRMGISVSRGSQANLSKDKVYSSAVDGIVFDGHEGRCTGVIDGCIVENTLGKGEYDAGIRVEASDVSVSNSRVVDSAAWGILFIDSSKAITVDNNQVYQNNVVSNNYGVGVFGRSTAKITGNHIWNFGMSGIMVEEGCTVEDTNNSFTSDGTDIPGDVEVDMEQLEAFVTRLYKNVLGRSPEAEGLADWVNRLATRQMTGAEVAHGFFFSDEFIYKGLGNEEYVDILYQTMFGQAGDEDGRRLWIDELETGFSQLYVYHGFAESVQFGNLCEKYGIIRGSVALTEPRDLNRGVTQFVSRNYTKALGRDVDIDGLNTWCNEIINNKMAPEKVVEGFIFSEEFIRKELNDGEFVNTMYATYFDRAADEAGFETWMDILANGGTRRDVMNGFSGADEFHSLVNSFNLPK